MATKSYAKPKRQSATTASLGSISRTSNDPSPNPLYKAPSNYKKRGTENDFSQFGNFSFGNTGLTGED